MPHYRVETQHPWPDSSFVGGLALVLTNLILVFPVVHLAWLLRFDYAAALLTTMLASIAYHGCRAGFFCEYRFRDHQITDHIFVFLTLIYVASRLAVRRSFFPRNVRLEYPEILLTARVAFFFAIVLPTVMANMYNPESPLAALFGFGVPIAVVILGACVSGERLFYDVKFGLIGSGLFLVSVAFYACAPHSWYQWSHSIWHLLSMLSVYFIIFAADPPIRLLPGAQEAHIKPP